MEVGGKRLPEDPVGIYGDTAAQSQTAPNQTTRSGEPPAGTSEEFDQVLALREEVDRLRDPVQETAWWLKNNGHPVKAGLLRKELGRIPEAGENACKSAGDPGG
jgi:hypothetical protein